MFEVDTNTRLSVSLGRCSSIGKKPDNRDFQGAFVPDNSTLDFKGIAIAVADGATGGPLGAEAAEASVTGLLSDYYDTPVSWNVRISGERVISAANALLHGRNQGRQPNDPALVCTLSALILRGREAHVLHVGNSRVQRLSGQSLEPLTRDHRDGPASAQGVVTRVMGSEDRVEIDYNRIPLARGDIFLVTTDGLHDYIDGAAVRRALCTGCLDEAAQALVDLAMVRGSEDNLSIQIVRVDDLPQETACDDSGGDLLPVPPVPAGGDTIDGLEVLRCLSTGQRSHIYLARTPEGGLVTLKIPAAALADNPAILRRYYSEDWIGRRVQSGHVARVLSPPEPRSATYVCREYIEGTTLRQWMTDNPNPELQDVRSILRQISEGLLALHRRGMLHNDLLPENVLVDKDGTVRIIDLTSASVVGVEAVGPGKPRDLHETLTYTAPETLAGEDPTWRSDQFSLAVIAYEMMTGRLPYSDALVKVRSRKEQLRLAYRPAHVGRHGPPDWIDATLCRACHPEPLRRYDSFEQFLGDLDQPFSRSQRMTLARRNPIRFWQSVSGLLALVTLALMVEVAT